MFMAATVPPRRRRGGRPARSGVYRPRPGGGPGGGRPATRTRDRFPGRRPTARPGRAPGADGRPGAQGRRVGAPRASAGRRQDRLVRIPERPARRELPLPGEPARDVPPDAGRQGSAGRRRRGGPGGVKRRAGVAARFGRACAGGRVHAPGRRGQGRGFLEGAGLPPGAIAL